MTIRTLTVFTCFIDYSKYTHSTCMFYLQGLLNDAALLLKHHFKYLTWKMYNKHVQILRNNWGTSCMLFELNTYHKMDFKMNYRILVCIFYWYESEQLWRLLHSDKVPLCNRCWWIITIKITSESATKLNLIFKKCWVWKTHLLPVSTTHRNYSYSKSVVVPQEGQKVDFRADHTRLESQKTRR